MLLVGDGMGPGVQAHQDAPHGWSTVLEPQWHPRAVREVFSSARGNFMMKRNQNSAGFLF